MTGYGTANGEAPAARITVEVRGVNQRFLDVKLSTPREYLAWEAEVRERVRAAVARGRVEVTITRTPLAGRRRYHVAVRRELARAYVESARRLGRQLGLGTRIELADVLRLPELLEVSEQPPEPAGELPALRRALAAALTRFDAERRREGRRLQRDMLGRLTALRRLTGQIERRLPTARAQLRRAIAARVTRLATDVGLEPARLAHEAAALAERSDISEEVVRLQSHGAALASTLRASGPIGKRIEFLLQEVHRELNTAGDKAGDRALGGFVLEAKGEVEKLREQVQNVE